MAEKFVFESAMKRIEEIVTMLERGDAPLDQSLALFEEGTKLIRKCGGALDKAEQQLRMLITTADTPETAAFSPEEQA